VKKILEAQNFLATRFVRLVLAGINMSAIMKMLALYKKMLVHY